MWDPSQYRKFAEERSRPFAELVARVRPEYPKLVVDLGCGPGELTATLARRWPDAEVRGIDSSAEMIAAAQVLLSAEPADGARVQAAEAGSGRLSFTLADATHWKPDRPADVIISNAVLQWIPDHLQVLARWAGFSQHRRLAGDPGARQLRSAQSRHPPRASQLAAPGDRCSGTSGSTARRLSRRLPGRAGTARAARWTRGRRPTCMCCTAPIRCLSWYRGTGLRPVLAALPPGAAAEFTAEYGARLREAYPAGPHGTVLAFRRVFAVAVRG